MKFINLNAHDHADLGISEHHNHKQIQNIGNCNILSDEIFIASGSFPVFLIKDSENGSFNISAIFGFKNNSNLFCQRDGWDAPYFPLNLKRLPFAISTVADPDGNAAHDIYIDIESDLVSKETGARIFDDAGNETKYLQEKKQILGALLQGREKTSHFISRLLEYGLISPVTITLMTLAGPEKISGLYGIDHAKMKMIDETTHKKLIDEDIIDLIYSIKSSYAQIHRMIWMENKNRENKIIRLSISAD